MEKKFIYEAPEMEQIKLRLESNQMQAASPTGETFSTQTGNDSEDGWS